MGLSKEKIGPPIVESSSSPYSVLFSNIGHIVIPDYAAMHWIVRAPTYKEVKILKGRVQACIE